MPWVTKSGVRIVGGKKQPYTYRVWVDAPRTTSRGGPPSPARLAAAKDRALTLAAAERKRLAQRKLWATLHDTSRDIRDSVVGGPSRRSFSAPGALVSADNYRNQRLVDASNAKRVADAEARRWQGYAAFYEKQRKKAQDRADLDAAKSQPGLDASGKTLERLIAEALAAQQKSGGTDVDTAFLNQVRDAYVAHVESVAANFKAEVDKLSNYYIVKNGQLVSAKSQQAYIDAMKLYNSKNFKSLQSEYDRLYGDGKKDLGAVTSAFTQFDQIAQSQRQYIYDAAKQALFKQVDALRQQGGRDDPAAAAKLLHDWESGGKYLFEAAASEIDPAKTSWFFKLNPDDSPGQPRMLGHQRTVEEEFQHRQAQYVTEMKRQYNEWEKSQKQVQLRSRVDRLRLKREANTPGYQAKQRDINTLARLSKTLGLGPKGPTTREDMTRLVDEAMKEWESENRKWFLSLGHSSTARGSDSQRTAADTAFAKARDAQKSRFYAVFGSESPGLLEQGANVPIVKQGLTALGAAGGVIPLYIRVAVKSATGNSTISIGIKLDTLPDKIKKQYLAWVREGGGPRDPWGLSLNAGFNTRAPLGILGAGNATDIPATGDSPLDTWLTTDEGRKWYVEYGKTAAAESQAQDDAFSSAFYGNGDIWGKLQALSTYGSTPFNNDALNLAQSLLLDPTNGIPLKATTWLARLAHAKQATSGITGLGGLKRLLTAAEKWATVTEPELRFQKTLAPYLRDLKNGADPSTVREAILTKLSGIVDGPSRAKETQRLFRQFGIDPRSESGHLMTSLVEESLIAKFKAAGIDYRDVAKQAGDMESARLIAEKAAREALSPNIAVVDAAAVRAEAAAQKIAEAGRGATSAARAAERAALEARAARPVIERQADDIFHTSTTTGHSEPAILSMRAADPLRRDVTPLRGAATEGLNPSSSRQAQSAADIVHSVTSSRDSVIKHGVEFSPGAYADEFLATPKAKRWIADLEAKMPNGRPNTAVRDNARAGLYEAGRRSHALRIAREEGLHAPLAGGVIPWVPNPDGVPYVVGGGRLSHTQYVVSASDLASRRGAHTPVEEILVASDSVIVEETKKRMLSLRAQLKDGRITESEFIDLARSDVADLALFRHSSDLAVDIQAGIPGLTFLEPQDILLPHRIAIGEQMVIDAMTNGELSHYYETLSLLPGYRSGAGYETVLMANILNPAWRVSLTRAQFTKLLSGPPFLPDALGPVEFRIGATHLFALFHMTLLDGNMQLLERYSKSIETHLARDPYNVYARAWKVMETRAGAPWAERFLDAETAFVEAVLHKDIATGKQRAVLHPNLALGMIAYGPIARHTPISHGFVGHLAGLATSTNPLFKSAPVGWVDASVTDALTSIFNRTVVGPAAVTVASQTASYVSARYGSFLTRAHFMKVMRDFSIHSSFLLRKSSDAAGYNIERMKALFIEKRAEQYLVFRKGNALERPDGSIDWTGVEGVHPDGSITAGTQQAFSVEFEALLTRPLRRGIKRREFTDLYEIYDDLYLANKISHDLPGLHSAMLFQKLGDPALRNGDSWVPYASSYFDHMVAAGAEAEARTVLKTLLEPVIYTNAGLSFEQITHLGVSVNPSLGETTRGAVNDFFVRANLLPDMRRVIAEGRQRVHASGNDVQLEVDNAAFRNDLLLGDEDARVLSASHDALDDTVSMYDYADIEHVVAETSRWGDKYTAVVRDAEAHALKYGEVAHGPIGEAMKAFYAARKKGGDAAGIEALRKFPKDVRSLVYIDLRKKAASRSITQLLNSVVHMTMQVDAIPVSVGTQMEELVALVEGMDGGAAFLASWADTYAVDLYQSRLIDYLKHQDWFIDREARGLTMGRVLQQNPALVDALAHGPPAHDPLAPAAVSPDPPRAPDPAELNHARVSMAQRGLEILGRMTEEEWLGRELRSAQRALNSATDSAARASAKSRINNARNAFRVIEVSKSGGRLAYATPKSRTAFVSTILSVAGDRAKAMIFPKVISAYVTGPRGALVEQGRSLWRTLKISPVDQSLVNARPAGAASDTYAKHGSAIEKEFSGKAPGDLLAKHGLPRDLMGDLSAVDIVVELGELKNSMRHPLFNDFVNELVVRMNLRLRDLTHDASYTVERWLDDRLVQHGDHFDARLYEEADGFVADAIAASRDGRRRTLRTDPRSGGDSSLIRQARSQLASQLRPRRRYRGENPLAQMIDDDIRLITAKHGALSVLGIDPHSYNQARGVLRSAFVKKKAAYQLVAAATKHASDVLYAAGHTVDDADWDVLFRKEYDEAFLAKRAIMADEEALKLLDALSREMLGSSATDIIAEFEKRYGKDTNPADFVPDFISPYQRRTLEQAVKTHLGVTDLDNAAQMVEGLNRHGQHPPFENRAAMRAWLVDYGFWSPQTGAAIEAGKKSWSIFDESAYYKDNWGYVPDWANPDLLEEGGLLNEILHNEQFYGEKNRLWGLFNRNMEARFATGKLTREQRARLLVEGSDRFKIKAKRDLPLERKYVMERYGRLVMDDSGNLTAFPWLMHLDEFRSYIIHRSAKGSIAEDLVQTVEELDVLERLIDLHVGKYFDEMVMPGAEVTYSDLFTMVANVSHDILKDPVWRHRDGITLGRVLKAQAEFRRALVFTQLGFLTTNVIDTGIKGPWSAFTNRAFRIGTVSEDARALSLLEFGIDRSTQLLHDVPVRGTERIRESTGIWDKLVGISELPAQGAGNMENWTKLRLAQGMYDGALARALKDGAPPGVADAAAREFIGKEVSRLWPTVGNGPIEKLFNTLSPFMSYQFKNRAVFLGEIAAHPALYNYFNRIGDFIEKQNRERWARERPNEVLPENRARLIELPWAPGLFIDLGQLSDAQRGLKPLYALADGKSTIGELASLFVRLAGPNDINFAYGLINTFNLSPRYGYVQQYKNGFPTGVWDKVQVPWEAPWGGAANLWNSFWPAELGTQFVAAMEGKWSAQELTKLVYQFAFFGGLKEYDKGAGLNTFYFALLSKDSDAAEAWLETADGAALRMWWTDKAGDAKDWYTPLEIKNILNPKKPDSAAWFHSQSEQFQSKVKSDLGELRLMRQKWDNIIWKLTPGTPERREAVLMSATERYNFYRTHPEMYEYEAFSKSPDEWAKQLNDWQVDDLVQAYFDMQVPKSGDFKSAVLWQKAVAEWKQSREAYLRMFPQVAERIGSSRDSVESVWRATEQGWFDALDKVGTRSIAIEAARQSRDFALVDQLYLVNDLSFDVLNEDVAVFYFDPTTDFVTLDRGILGPLQLKTGPFGQELLQRVKVLPDFNKWRFGRMSLQEKANFERDQKYVDGMKGIIAKAKAAKSFGATFVSELKKNPDLLAEYFRRNPGKREAWAATDEYIRLMGHYGSLAKQGKFTEAGRYFDKLPDWVKARYFSKHPERRQQLQQNLQYMNFMEQWTKFYRKRDYSGGAAFFENLPQWVKDRYYSKHPDGAPSGGTSAYSKALGGWVDLLKAGKKAEAKAYFDALPQAYRDKYYAKHPDQKLKNDIKRVGQLGQYFAADDANRALYLQNNPEFAKWLAAQGNSESTRRMMIMAAYQGLPKDDQWLRRVFREKYPEIFSAAAKGDASLKKTYNFLADHPDMLPAFEKWLAAVWESYAQNLKHTANPPKPIVSDHSSKRDYGRGRSAAWVRLHSSP